ncbi:MAG: hypothetical protein AAF498_11330 [Pseudomonadota bacterium]
MTAATPSRRFADVRAVIEAEQSVDPPVRALEMANVIRAHHGDCVKGFVFYGSGLREADNPQKMLDYYVLVDRYRSVHKGFGIKALASLLLPPSVHYLEATDSAGQFMSSKYSIVSMSAFVRRASGGAQEPMIWGRFSQPCLIMACESEDVRGNLIDALAQAVIHFADQARPLMDGRISPRTFWSRALAESYRTELRAERPLERATEIVERFGERYDALGVTAIGAADSDGLVDLGSVDRSGRMRAQISWALRRWVGKPATALRVLKAGFTFDGGLDYVLHKLKSHSGVTIPVTEHQRRHPILWSPILAWRLWRRGAFR